MNPRIAELLSLPPEWRWLAVVEADMRGEVEADKPRRCGVPAWDPEAFTDDVERCNGLSHTAGGWMRRRCPALVLDEIRAQFGARAELASGKGFAALDLERYRAGAGGEARGEKRVAAATRALHAMRQFANAEVPAGGVILSGDTGLGKSHLLLTSHFLRLELGYPSVYITSGQLRPLFRDAESRDESVHGPSRSRLHSLSLAKVVHLDDLGDVRGAPAFHQSFAAGIKALLDTWLDRTGTRLAVALNLKSAAASEHPDIGDRVLSRLCDGAERIGLEGEDQRLAEVTR